jgi:glycosyltransferase involved in cell wall biosynthesis
MNWVFLDFVRIDYDVATPLERPLGGSQSALAYLALALARRGQRVTTLTGTSKPRDIEGIRCLRIDDIPAEIFAPKDTIVVVNCGPADVIDQVRPAIPERKIVLWTGHAHDQPAVQSLRDPASVKMWDRIACVSEWQKSMFHQHLGVPLEKIEVARNAIAPAFERLFCDETDIIRAKSSALRLAYTSTPFRGLEILLACFPAISKLHAGCQLDVFSSMQVYGRTNEKDQYQALYDRCRATDGIEYRGAVPQPVLAKELTATSILAYPNTFAETSCIAVMEALAAGMLVVTSDLGGLPETCSDFARLIPPISKPHRTAEQFAMDYAKTLDQAIRDWKSDHGGVIKKRFEQSEAINATCTWDIRAAEWIRLADRWLSGSS